MSALGSAHTQALLTVRSPVDGRIVGRVPDSGPQVVAERARALRESQPGWRAIGPRGRARHLRVLRDWLLDHERHVVDVLVAETGKARADAATEIPLVCDLINYYAGHAEEFLADERPRPHGPVGFAKRLTVTRHPYPVAGVITPWNYPLAMPGLDVVPALLAGTAVLLKPSEVTPLTALELARGWREIGAPPVLEVVTGGAGTGAAVVDHADFVQFTGSVRTGRAVAVRAAERLVPFSLELGGKDAAIVLADADLDRAVQGIAWGGMFNAGQTCVSVERVYVEAPVHDKFVRRLTRLVSGLRTPEESDGGRHLDVGALATPAQRDLVHRQVTEALSGGARALTGGVPGAVGTSYRPTVLVDVHHSMACMREETFGPTLPVMKVADADEAVRLANDSPYGLSASVWTRDTARGEAIARRLEAGAVNINDVYSNLLNFPLPHGGWKESGTGVRLGGAQGMRKYTRQQAITAPRGPCRPGSRSGTRTRPSVPGWWEPCCAC
ncbi:MULTISPECIES: aldehyde dehydrogenase family protein [unclassified Streptomyces]|uniref:aldehyde dehydrogenase family protein n=1 Tax=unclassified Streptomyces TaxID=2593676 RepID=UPI0023662757|nr:MULTISPECIES: aldehyde dehydrogenase family protein [unclassified Streptomyces]MDF3144732.1 aldehyde dehydrogenase family protein [Streptomyces sp. T21Q-yed]WDF36053.1 aldehyde dehydrogenase family protein [Streptomyces sp. T12]